MGFEFPMATYLNILKRHFFLGDISFLTVIVIYFNLDKTFYYICKD